MQPASPVVPPKPKGTVGLWVGAAIILVGISGGVLVAFAGVRSIIDTVNSYQRVAPSGGTVTIDDPGTYRVFIERPGVDGNSGFFFQPRVSIVDPSGRPSPLQTDASTQTYSWDGHDGRSLGRFEAREPGQYRIVTESGAVSSAAVLAVGQGSPAGGVFAIGGGILGGILVVLVGIIVMIVSGVRRSRSKRQLAGGYVGSPLGGWAPPPTMAPTGPGGPGGLPPGGPTNAAGGSPWPTGGGAIVGPGWAAPPPAPGWAPPPTSAATTPPAGAGWAAPSPPAPTGPSWAPPPPGPSGHPLAPPPPMSGPPASDWPPPPPPWSPPEGPGPDPEHGAPDDSRRSDS